MDQLSICRHKSDDLINTSKIFRKMEANFVIGCFVILISLEVIEKLWSLLFSGLLYYLFNVYLGLICQILALRV